MPAASDFPPGALAHDDVAPLRPVAQLGDTTVKEVAIEVVGAPVGTDVWGEGPLSHEPASVLMPVRVLGLE